MSERTRYGSDKPDCGLCGHLSETRKPYPCACGDGHVVCLGCAFRAPDLLLTLEDGAFPICPLSDEYRVALELMARDRPAGGNQRANFDPERVKVITARRKQIFTQKALKQFADEGRSLRAYLDGEEA